MTIDAASLAYIKEGKVILKAQADHPERIIGEVKDDEQSSLQYFIDRFELATKRVAALKELIDTNENKGSFLVKLQHLRSQLLTFDAIGDYRPLFDELDKYEHSLEEYISQNRKKNLELKRGMLEELKEQVINPNWGEATNAIKEIRNRWIRVGAVAEEFKEETEDLFAQLTQEFFDKKKAFYEQKQQLMADRELAYERLIDELKKLSKLGAESSVAEKVTEIKEHWKNLENIPKDKYDRLLRDFKKTSEVLLKGIQQTATNNNLSPAQIVAEKNAILAELRTLISPDKIGKEVLSKIKHMQNAWKNYGRIGREEAEKLNKEFFFLCDMAFEKSFIHELAAKRNKGADDLTNQKIKLLSDLLHRDQRELANFEENMEKFNLGAQELDKMLMVKLNKQRRKVAVKLQLLKDLRNLKK